MKYLAVVLAVGLFCAIYVECKSSELKSTTLKPEVTTDHEVTENKEKTGVMSEAGNSTDVSSAGKIVLPPGEKNKTEESTEKDGAREARHFMRRPVVIAPVPVVVVPVAQPVYYG